MRVEVSLGVLRDARGRVLTMRGAAPPLAGLWHFPGGKLEPGEDARAALQRELHEELGVMVQEARLLCVRRYQYASGPRFCLRAWLVESWGGAPRPPRHMESRWEDPAVLRGMPIPPPNRTILAVLLLPPLYLVTPEQDPAQDFSAHLRAGLALGAGLVQLRCDRMEAPRYEALARRAGSVCRAAGALLFLNRGEPGHVPQYADGLHLKSARLREACDRGVRSRQGDRSWLSVSCHNHAELRMAVDLEADCALLGPVRRTPTHPEARPLGWKAFARLARLAELPVYALGGLRPADLERARAAGAHGVAARRGLWPSRLK